MTAYIQLASLALIAIAANVWMGRVHKRIMWGYLCYTLVVLALGYFVFMF